MYQGTCCGAAFGNGTNGMILGRTVCDEEERMVPEGVPDGVPEDLVRYQQDLMIFQSYMERSWVLSNSN